MKNKKRRLRDEEGVEYKDFAIEPTSGSSDRFVVIYCDDNGYNADQVRELTVGTLKEFLNEFNDDDLVVVKTGGRYGANYWGIDDIEDEQIEEDEWN